MSTAILKIEINGGIFAIQTALNEVEFLRASAIHTIVEHAHNSKLKGAKVRPLSEEAIIQKTGLSEKEIAEIQKPLKKLKPQKAQNFFGDTIQIPNPALANEEAKLLKARTPQIWKAMQFIGATSKNIFKKYQHLLHAEQAVMSIAADGIVVQTENRNPYAPIVQVLMALCLNGNPKETYQITATVVEYDEVKNKVIFKGKASRAALKRVAKKL